MIEIAEAVLYDSNGTIILEKKFHPIHMQDGDSIEFTWKLDVNSGGLYSREVDLDAQISQTDPQVIISENPDYEAAVFRWKERFGEG